MTRIHFAASILHPLRGCTHGPKTWPWWRWVSFSIVKLGPVVPPSTGYALWAYTRGKEGKNTGRYLDIYFDRRSVGVRAARAQTKEEP
jgi:hypothetical protein